VWSRFWLELVDWSSNEDGTYSQSHVHSLDMDERSKAPDSEHRSKVVGSIPVHPSNFSTPDCKKNQQGKPSQGNQNLH